MMTVTISAFPERDCTWVEDHDTTSCDECWDERVLPDEIFVNLRHRVDKPGATVMFGQSYFLQGRRDERGSGARQDGHPPFKRV